MTGTILIVILSLVGIRIWLYSHVRRNWKTHDTTNECSVQEKVVVITGANSGIGKVTALELVSRGATVVLACRNLEAAANTLCEIRSKTNHGNMAVMKLNLASFKSIRKFASNFCQRFDTLHILINNAGIISPSRLRSKTKDGHELHFGVNHLGHFLLTNLLLDHLKAGEPSRVITLTSHIHIKGHLDFDDLAGDHKTFTDSASRVEFPLYSNSKLANVYFSQELGRRLTGTGVTTYAVCPGDVATGISRGIELSPWVRFLLPHFNFLFKTPEEGAQTTLYCSLSPDLTSQTGLMYRNCANWPLTERIPLEDSISRKLWTVSEKLVGLG